MVRKKYYTYSGAVIHIVSVLTRYLGSAVARNHSRACASNRSTSFDSDAPWDCQYCSPASSMSIPAALAAACLLPLAGNVELCTGSQVTPALSVRRHCLKPKPLCKASLPVSCPPAVCQPQH